MGAKLLHSSLTLCDRMVCNPPCFSVHGILQAKILELLVAISFSRRSSQPRDQACISFCCRHQQASSLPLAPPGKPKSLYTRYYCLAYWFDSWVGKIGWRRDRLPTPVFLGFPSWLSWKRIRLQCRRPGFDIWVGKIPWRRERLPSLLAWRIPWTV